MNHILPRLVTFDGEARSGKGTIAQMTKDYLRDQMGLKVMLIDRGQTFRALVVAAARVGVDLDDPNAIDAYLGDEENVASCTQFVKDVYRMSKEERDGLLYTNEVSANSAKIGARAGSQKFVADLTKKWLRDAAVDGYEAVLVDGRTLEAIAREMHTEGLCDYRLGFYFVCDAQVGARRTLGYADRSYDELTEQEKEQVDELIEQIGERNSRDRERDVEPLLRPEAAPLCVLPDMSAADSTDPARPMVICDSSAELTKDAMSLPVSQYVAAKLA